MCIGSCYWPSRLYRRLLLVVTNCLLYCNLDLFKEEEERKLKAADQIAEGELLVANHQLEVDVGDAETAARNKHRRYETNIITLVKMDMIMFLVTMLLLVDEYNIVCFRDFCRRGIYFYSLFRIQRAWRSYKVKRNSTPAKQPGESFKCG